MTDWNEANEKDPFNNNSYGTLVDSGYKQVSLPVLDVLDFNLNAQNAVEAPRFQTRHLVSSFDNHAWNRGDLLLDERIPPATYTDLTERGHQTSSRSRYANGAAPVAIKVLPSGVIEAGADPFYNRSAHAW